MLVIRVSIWTIAVFTLGCVASPVVNVDLAGPTTTEIVVSGKRNLGDAQVSISDPASIKQILSLIQDIRRGFTYARLNLDLQHAKIVCIQIHPEVGESEITMINGMMIVPGNDRGIIYDPGSKAQTQLWGLLLSRLESVSE